MVPAIHITASCIISDHSIIKNGKPVFEENGIDLHGFLTEAYQFLEIKYPKFYKMDHLSKIGWIATEILLSEGFDKTKYKAEDMGVVLMNAASSLDADIKYFNSTEEIASPALFVYTLPNIVIGEISIRHNFKGESAFFIWETFDAVFLQQYVSNLFNNNLVQACICGWIEVIGESYKTVLLLAENNIESKGVPAGGMAFTKENINNIYHLHNG